MKIIVYDIETMKGMFLFSAYDPNSNQWFDFEISRNRNNLYSLMSFLENNRDCYFVGYNCLRFDGQVVEWMYRRYESWFDLSNEQIVEKIYQKAQDVIDDSNYDVFPDFREEELSFKQIDLFTIWHFNNENRRTSLKALEFSMNMENIEEMPIDHNKEELSDEEIKQVIAYCHNDIIATYEFYKITRGETDIPIYKGEDKIADRLIMQEEFGLSCLNWDDVKIGAEWNKMDYLATTSKSEKDLKPKEIKTFYGRKFKVFFPKYIKFQTPALKQFAAEFKEKYATNQKQEFKYTFPNGLVATIAKGGIHSNEGGRFLQPNGDEIYWQVDIGSQYPNAIRKYKVEPPHLPGWNRLIVSKIDRRLNYKRMAKETGNPKYNSMQKMGKLSLNGGSYGRLNTKGDWQEYPFGMLQVTIGGQMEILMVVEDLILKGFNVVSLNTDGFDCIIPRKRDEEFKSLLTGWEEKIGNSELGNFEYTEFLWIAQTSVNDYLALKPNGEYKAKGDFEIDKEIHKNSSARIVPIALKEYFINDVPIEETIRKHTNIYDFCIRQKASRDFHYEGLDRKTGNTTIYNKLIRYYVSNKGEKVYKIKNPSCQTNAPNSSQVEAGEWLCTVCNHLPKTDATTMDINYDYYIERTNKILHKVKTGKKKTIIIKDPNQLTLF